MNKAHRQWLKHMATCKNPDVHQDIRRKFVDDLRVQMGAIGVDADKIDAIVADLDHRAVEQNVNKITVVK